MRRRLAPFPLLSNLPISTSHTKSLSVSSARNFIVVGKFKLNGYGQIPIEAVYKIRFAE